MKDIIFTIGRQYGSGGHEIGTRLAKKLDLPFYDNELISLAAQKSGVSRDVFEQLDEKPTNSFLYSLAMGAFNMGGFTTAGFGDISLNDKLFVAQSEIIQDAAHSGGCVVVGRCADYVLREFDNTVDVFVYADIESRTQRIGEILKLPQQKVIDTVNKKDKTRANYYNYYSNKKWGETDNYDLMVNTSSIDYDKAVDLIIYFSQLKFD